MTTEVAVGLQGNFIGGEWLPASSGRTFENRNPADRDDLVGIFPESGREDVEAAVDAASGAYPGWRGPYDLKSTFHEPFVVFGFLAAVTSLELVTGIIILPQRQTVLVPKQAAGVELLTRGKWRHGVGHGWTPRE